jgi:tRNA (guanine-N7-)-methyltransferase
VAAGEAPPGPERKFYGRRRGKALRPAQARLVDELLPRLSVPGVAPLGAAGRRTVDPAALFPDAREIWLEIGFGAGEHLVHQAALHPEVGLLGAEPFVNGVAALLARLAVAGIGNVRLHPGDARDLIDLLPDRALARVFLLYPDPWPKTRHRERRFMNPENLAALARVLRPDGDLRLATDVAAYARHALRAAAEEGSFALATAPEDLARPWADWRVTRYETKALREGRTPHYLTFRRR